MAIVEVKVPELSESVAEATLVEWKKKPGELVQIDEILVEIETDKVVLEVPAPSAGVMAQLVKDDGELCVSGEVIAKIDTEGAEAVSPLPVKPVPRPRRRRHRPQPPRRGRRQQGRRRDAGGSQADGREPDGCRLGRRHRPGRPRHQGRCAGRRRIRRCQGTGGGCAGCRPPAAALPKVAPPPLPRPLAKAAAPTLAALSDRPEQRVPMSRLRARVAERLLQSQATNAILTTFNEVNMAPVMEMRKRFQEKFEKEHGVKIGFMSFFVKAAVAALKRYPVINASVDGNDIVYHGYFDIGIAVGSPRGLVVPILRNADQMSFAEIEKKIAEFGQKARDGKLSLDDLTGGTFSISNGGTFGSMLSTPIINPPQSAILGVHATKDRAVVENGQVVVRPMNYLAMSYDHRIIDGREAVLGLVAMKEALEDPARLLFDI